MGSTQAGHTVPPNDTEHIMQISSYTPPRWVRSKERRRPHRGVTFTRVLIKKRPEVISPRGERSVLPGGILLRLAVALGVAR